MILPTTDNRKSLIYFGLSFILSIFLVWYLLSHIELEALFKTFQNLYLSTLSVYVLLALGGVLARSYRYYILISSPKITMKELVLVTLVRNLFVDLLPARIGSLSYVYLLNKRFGFPFEIAASTFLVAFIFDFIVVFPLLFLAIIMVSTNLIPFMSFSFIIISVFVFGFLVAFLFYLSHLITIFVNLIMWCSQRLGIENNSRLKVLREKLLLTAKDIETIKTRKIYGKVFFTSLAVRIFKYGSLYFLLHSVLVHLNFAITDLNFWKVILGILGAEFSALLPIHGVAGLGSWEAAWVLTFKLLGFFDPQVAIVSGFSVHIITQIFEYFLGILSIIILYLPHKKFKRGKGSI